MNREQIGFGIGVLVGTVITALTSVVICMHKCSTCALECDDCDIDDSTADAFAD